MESNEGREHLEETVISAAFSGHEAVDFIRSALPKYKFRAGDIQAVWSVLVKFTDAGTPFDLELLFDELVKNGNRLHLDRLAELYTGRFQASHVSMYCKRLQQYDQTEALKDLAAAMALDDSPDVDEYIAKFDQIRDTGTQDIFSAPEAVDAMIALRQKPDGVHSTGITAFDEMLGGGLRDGQVCIVGGRPGAGKSVLMMQIALGAIEKGDSVLVVSLEMLKEELMERLNRRMHIDDLKELSMWFVDSTSNLEAILALCRLAHRRHNIGMIVVDYLQLLEVSAAKGEGREAQVAKASRRLKRLAMDLKIPIVVGSQLNRSGVDSPTLANLRESGAIEQDANVVVLIQEPEEYDEPSKLLVAKNRGGKTGKFEMKLVGREFRFEEVEKRRVADYDDADASWR